jgi:DNA-binding transcriptional ArsR family regulator
MNNKTILVETFGNSPIIRIIDFFIDNPLFDYSKEEIIKYLGISKVTFYKYFVILENNEMVEVTRKVGKAKMYKLDEKNEVTKKIKGLIWVLGIKAAEMGEKEMKPVVVKS